MQRPFQAYDGDEPYVFVCYSHEDRTLVYPELTRLREAGFHLWYDEGISPGSEWSDTLAGHIEHSAVFLYFVTPRSVLSERCRREVNYALEQPCGMLAVHLERTELPSGLKLTLSNRQAILKYEEPREVYEAKVGLVIRHAERHEFQAPGSSGTLAIGDWTLDVGRQRLSRGTESRVLDPKAWSVLLHLVDRAPDVVSRQGLIDRTWPNVVVGENVLDQAITQLRRALGDDARHPRYIETQPRRGYRLMVPLAISGPGTPPPLSATATAPLIAVLPFDNLSADDEFVYFSDGLSEEILQTVSRSTGLKVIGRSSSFQFRGRHKGAHRVAAALGCTHVLDGAVRRSGNRIRVSVQLIDCGDQTTLWSDRFDRELADVFKLQDEIAAAVAQALQVTFARPGAASPVEPAAYDLYLKAKASQSQWLGASDTGLLEEAISHAPEFAEAWAALAISRAIEFHLERDPARSVPARTRAIEAANAALGLDSNLGVAYAALSIVEPVCGRFLERDTLITQALRVSPNDPLVLFWAGRWSCGVGRLRDNLGYMTRAYAIDPLWPQGVHGYAGALWVTGFEAEAERVWDDAMTRWPDLPYLFAAQLGFAALRGRWDRFAHVVAEAKRLGMDAPTYQRELRRDHRLQNWTTQDTVSLRNRLTRDFAKNGSVSFIQQFACGAGLTDFVYDLFERMNLDHLFEPAGRTPEGDYGLHHLFSPTDTMRRDPRFIKLCARLGLCDYWVKTGRWPDCADELAPFYDFRAEAMRYAQRVPR